MKSYEEFKAESLARAEQAVEKTQRGLENIKIHESLTVPTSHKAVGYSSDYYKHEMASAIKNGNEIAYKNAKSNYAEAVVQEVTKYSDASGFNEQQASAGSKLAYSSDYYKHQMASAIENGNEIAYKNAKRHYGEKLADEQTKK